MSLKIALLGSIPKGDEAQVLYGDAISDNVGPALVVGHDLWMVREADVLIVDAPTKVGAGTAQEMILAKHFGKTVITMIPPNSHHRRSNVTFDGVLEAEWIHPFLLESSDSVAGSPAEAVQWLAERVAQGLPAPKDLQHFEDLIAQFEARFPDLVERYRRQGTVGARTTVAQSKA